jgi:hypothetical protein
LVVAIERPSHHCTLGVLQRETQFLRELVDRGSRPFPGAIGLEPEVADTAPPGGDDPADRPEITPIGVLLVEPPDDVGRDANEGPERRRLLD